MRKHFFLIALALCVQVWAATVTAPANLPQYYSTYINNKSASTLFTGIHNVAKVGYSSFSYDGLWTAYATTDVYPAGHSSAGLIWDMYGGCTFKYGPEKNGGNQCGTYSGECDCYNREHSIPKSWFGGSVSANTPGTDIFHVVPTDGKVNGMRSNYAFGEVNSASYSHNGSQLGTAKSITISNTLLGEGNVTKSCTSSPVFEPIDEYKGDFARGYFGTMIRWAGGDYQTFTSGDGAQIFNTAYDEAHYYGLTQYGLALLLKWHRQDPVSQKEIDRNNGIQTTQGNRNPFIDYPILAEYLWGKYADQTFSVGNAVGSFESSFIPGVSDGDKNGSSIDPIPADYYTPVDGLQDSVLKSRLAELTWTHYTKRYSYGKGANKTWQAFWSTDRNATDNSVIDMYSNNKRYFNPSDTTASVTDCDIEHMFPNSWFGGEDGNKHAYCDLHHLVPADYSANRSKSNNGPGVPTDTTFNNAVWVNGKDANRDNLVVFCPPDQYKGDFARAFFYIATTYGDTAVWQTDNSVPHMTNSDWHEFLSDTRDLLLSWHRQDPVSEKELIRNNTVYSLQGNRNPFIDYPCLVEYIWGNMQGETFDLSCNAAPTAKYTITWNVKGSASSSQVTEGTKPTAPSVANCSADRVFVGWTTSPVVSSTKPELLYKSSEIPNATASTIYYAVFADKEGEGSDADYTLYNGTLVEGDYIIYYGGKAMKASVSSAARLEYAELTPSNNTISSPAANVVWHIAQNGNYWTIYNASVGKYAASTGTKNQSTLNADVEDEKILWMVSDKYDFTNKYNAANSVNALLRNNGTYGFACYSSQTGDVLSLYKTTSTVTYSNYGLYCSTLQNVSVTFHKNDGTDETKTQVIQEQTSTALESNTWSRNHYTFLGWATTSTGAVSYANKALINTNADIDLYAVWQEDPKYTVTFMNGTSLHEAVTGYAGEEILIYNPTVCESYTFVGWSTAQYAVDNIDEPSTIIPSTILAANTTYYAVYSKTEGGGTVTTNVLIEDYQSVSGTFDNYTFTAEKNNGGTAPAYNTTGKDGRLYAKNSLAISTSTAMTQIVFNLSSQGKKRLAPITASVGTIATQTSGDETVTWTGSSTAVTFTVGDNAEYGSDGNTKAGQLCFLSVDITTGFEPVTYYTTAPDCEPVVQPEYTVIFMDRGTKFHEETGTAGDDISLPTMTDECTANTFIGWSGQQYSENNIDYPSIVADPTIIPAQDTTYYAVYSKTAPSTSVPTNNYKKITTTDELTSAKYLVVADTSKLVAMSSEFSGYYLQGVEVIASADIITTENNAIIWSITIDDSQLTFYNTDKGYLYIEQSIKNEKTYYNIKFGNNTTNNKFSYSANEDASCVFTSVTYPSQQLEYYQSNKRWSFYSGQDAPIYLYKQQLASGELTFYSTEPTCQYGPMTDINILRTPADVRKLLINGQIFILREGFLYTLTGQWIR